MKKILVITVAIFEFVYGNPYLSKEDPELTSKEVHSLKIAKNWLNKGVNSIMGKDGSVTYIFGATIPSIVTAPLRITDIRLEEGEVIREIQLGDTVRWMVSPSLSGTAPNEVSHIIVKPTDANLSTTLAIFTDKRTYNINLVSTISQYIPIINFHYADEIQDQWKKYKQHQAKREKEKQFNTGTNVQNIDSLDFGYRVEGNYSWRPERVYNDGRKTYIQMPKSMNSGEAPILMVLSGSDKKLVNYRLKNNRFIVDKIFSKAILIKGVGSEQEKIVISRAGSSNSISDIFGGIRWRR